MILKGIILLDVKICIIATYLHYDFFTSIITTAIKKIYISDWIFRFRIKSLNGLMGILENIAECWKIRKWVSIIATANYDNPGSALLKYICCWVNIYAIRLNREASKAITSRGKWRDNNSLVLKSPHRPACRHGQRRLMIINKNVARLTPHVMRITPLAAPCYRLGHDLKN